LAGWRHIEGEQQRTKVDFAKQMKDLVDIYCRDADVIRLVVDNLNIHNPAALYEVFEPQEARRILQKRFVPLYTQTCQLVEPSGD
jgi:hypothetical protein